MKRPIIKTKPVRPYRIARAVIAAIVVVVIAVLAWFVWERMHPAHALAPFARVAQEDSPRAAANAPSPAILS